MNLCRTRLFLCVLVEFVSLFVQVFIGRSYFTRGFEDSFHEGVSLEEGKRKGH